MYSKYLMCVLVQTDQSSLFTFLVTVTAELADYNTVVQIRRGNRDNLGMMLHITR